MTSQVEDDNSKLVPSLEAVKEERRFGVAVRLSHTSVSVTGVAVPVECQQIASL